MLFSKKQIRALQTITCNYCCAKNKALICLNAVIKNYVLLSVCSLFGDVWSYLCFFVKYKNRQYLLKSKVLLSFSVKKRQSVTYFLYHHQAISNWQQYIFDSFVLHYLVIKAS